MSDAAASDSELLRRTHEALASDVSLIASEFLAGFQAVERIDRPGRVDLRLRADRRGLADLRGRADDRAALRRRRASRSSRAVGPA